MPVKWRFEDGILWLESDEHASFDEWILALNDASIQSEWRPGMSVIHDATRMLRFPSPVEAQSRTLFILRRAKALGILRWAVAVPEIIAKRDAAGFAARAESRCRMFTDLQQAEAWVREAPGDGDGV